ncbi:MAG: lysophospholipid acyltransferase family protein [Rhodospirillales bacterium]
MTLLKKAMSNTALRRLASLLAALYVRLVYVTGRWRVVRADVPEALWNAGTPFILAFWHGRLLMMPKIWPHTGPASRPRVHVLISQHRDGQLIARTVEHLGHGTIAGSSRRGGSGALRAMIGAIKIGESVAISPDGPRGPRMRASEGIVSLARVTGAPIIAAAVSSARGVNLPSWDRFLVPAPFSRGVFVWGERIDVARNAGAAEMETARAAVEDALNNVTAEADTMMGRAVIEPAAPEPAPPAPAKP